MRIDPRKLLKKLVAVILVINSLSLMACRQEEPPEEDLQPPKTDTNETADQNIEEKTPMNIKNYGRIDYTAGEGLLYNGIRLPKDWPPKEVDPMTDEVMIPPYLIPVSQGGERPDVIDITVGRQLFVDDFLIEKTDLKTVYHAAVKYEGNPILKSATAEELKWNQGVGLSAGGVWYDMEDCKYKMWYDICFNWGLGYAESEDGINWKRVPCTVSGSNVVMDEKQKNGTCCVFIDYEAPKTEKYKMFMQSFNNHEATRGADGKWYVPEEGKVANHPTDVLWQNPDQHLIEGTMDDNQYAHTLYVSPDGIHWAQVGGTSSGLSGDASSAFYNEFTNKWVNSLRTYTTTVYNGKASNGRVRYYAEGDTFTDLLRWKAEDAVLWLKTDRNDPIDPVSGAAPQTYNFGAIAYESIMFGAFTVWRGPENHIIAQTGDPKINEIMASFSRDGFHFDRPDRTPFIPASRKDGCFDKGYLFATAGSMIVHDDEIWFYYSGFPGRNIYGNKDAHSNQQIGLAILRRDGFASLEGSGELLTRTLTVNEGKKYLFVNIDAPEHSVKAEILNPDGTVMEGFSADDCIAAGGDDTCRMISWKHGKDLSFLNGTEFKIRFYLEGDGKLYSFWLSDSERGESGGAVGAGYVSQERLLKD